MNLQKPLRCLQVDKTQDCSQNTTMLKRSKRHAETKHLQIKAQDVGDTLRSTFKSMDVYGWLS
jgi:hypothetical protein